VHDAEGGRLTPPARDEGIELGFEPCLDTREAWEQDGIRVVSAGPNAFVYFLDEPEPVALESIEARWPGLPARLSKSAGVGFVLARANGGPVCFWRGEGHRLANAEGGPFAGREDREVVLRDLTTLMAMPSAGDLVVYGVDAPDGHVSFIHEVGAHAGPSPEEIQTFIVAPATVSLPASIDHPLQLFDVFIRYQSGSVGPGERPEMAPARATTRCRADDMRTQRRARASRSRPDSGSFTRESGSFVEEEPGTPLAPGSRHDARDSR
jgi:hypothetical protein